MINSMEIIFLLKGEKNYKIVEYSKIFNMNCSIFSYCKNYYEILKKINNKDNFFIYTNILECLSIFAYNLKCKKKNGFIIYDSGYNNWLVTEFSENYSESYFISPADFAFVGKNSNIKLMKSCYLYLKDKTKSIHEASDYVRKECMNN